MCLLQLAFKRTVFCVTMKYSTPAKVQRKSEDRQPTQDVALPRILPRQNSDVARRTCKTSSFVSHLIQTRPDSIHLKMADAATEQHS